MKKNSDNCRELRGEHEKEGSGKEIPRETLKMSINK